MDKYKRCYSYNLSVTIINLYPFFNNLSSQHGTILITLLAIWKGKKKEKKERKTDPSKTNVKKKQSPEGTSSPTPKDSKK